MKIIRQALDAHMMSLNKKQRMAFKDKINGMSEAQRANMALEIMKMHPQFRDQVARLQIGGIIPVPEQPGKVHQQTITSNYTRKDGTTIDQVEGKGKKAVVKAKTSNSTSKSKKEVRVPRMDYVVTDQPSNVSGEGQPGELPRQWDYTKPQIYKPLHEIGLESVYPVDEQYNPSPEVKKTTEYITPELESLTANNLGQAMGTASKVIFDNRFRVNPYTATQSNPIEKTDKGLLESPSTNRVPEYPELEVGKRAKMAELPLEMRELGMNRVDLNNMVLSQSIQQDQVRDPLEITQRLAGPQSPQPIGDLDRGYVTKSLDPKEYTRAEISQMSSNTQDSKDKEGLEMLKAQTPYGEKIFVKNRKTNKWETANWNWEEARNFAKKNNYKQGGIV